MTIPGGFVAGDVLGAADMNLLPAGKMAYASRTSNQTGIVATEVDLTSLTVTWTAVSSRLYKVSFFVQVEVGANSVNPVLIQIHITDGSNTKKQTAAHYVTNTSNSPQVAMNGYVLETGLSGSTTRKLRGTGIATYDWGVKASATQPAYILVEDIGPA